MARIEALLALSLALAGCTLSSGVPYRVQTESQSSITILTDPALRSLPQVRQVAAAHCAQFGKTAVQMSVGKLRGGQAPVTFACRQP
jgi:hypothetical protein